MPVLSVDLARRRWSDLGIVVLDHAHPSQVPIVTQPGAGPAYPVQPLFTNPLYAGLDQNNQADHPIACEIIPSISPGVTPGPVDADILAGLLNHLSNVRGIRVIMLDGPQAWKSRSNGLEHSRVSERQLNTAAKTGLPGMVKPVTYRPFAEFCLDVYDALCRRGWRRLETKDQPGSAPERVLVESYPFAAWKSLGLKPLPSKRRTRISDLAEAYGALRSLIPFTTNRPPNHDQLQAIVGGLSGLALEERNTAGARIVGTPPRREEGHWREGFIVLPVVPSRPLNTARSTSLRFLD
ncbi:MAG: hypothetical protein ABR987_18655 [Terracidiphilus sp.]|jgi:hypothetical protein